MFVFSTNLGSPTGLPLRPLSRHLGVAVAGSMSNVTAGKFSAIYWARERGSSSDNLPGRLIEGLGLLPLAKGLA